MSRVSFRQADMERVIKAATAQGAAVQVDMRTLVVTVLPQRKADFELDERLKRTRILPPGNLAPDGKDNF